MDLRHIHHRQNKVKERRGEEREEKRREEKSMAVASIITRVS